METIKSMEYVDHYVAFLDILGFKSIIDRFPCDEIYSIFSELHRRSKASLNINGVQVKAYDHIRHMILSDSIILFIQAEIEDAFAALIDVCSRLQATLANRDDPILLRGGIAVGELFHEDDIIYGKGLTSAYLLENNLAKYPRIVFTGDTLKNGKKNTKYLLDDIEGSWLSYRKDEDYLYFVDYFPTAHGKYAGDARDYYDRLFSLCDNWFNKEIDTALREKYIWIIKNIEKAIKTQPAIEQYYKKKREEEWRVASENYNTRFRDTFISVKTDTVPEEQEDTCIQNDHGPKSVQSMTIPDDREGHVIPTNIK